MPSYHEVRLYLGGLWLLIKGDAQGFRLLDMSDRGMMRSFWAFVWCLPPAILSWLWLRDLLLQGMPAETKLGAVFFLRTAMLEGLNWAVPAVLASLLCLLAGIQRKLPAIIVTMNWLTVPFSWIYGLFYLLLFVFPKALPVVALIQYVLLLASVIALSRVMRMICGPQPLMIAALVLVVLVPGTIMVEAMQRFLDIYPF